jgi:hypothetical protein
MTRARLRVLLFFFVVALCGAVFAVATIGHEPTAVSERPLAQRPALLLLTSLPLLFSEDFSLQDSGSLAVKKIETRYRVIPISVTDPHELAKGRLLLMAQPLAQTAENLVALDNWVRGGGRLLLLADPLLEWSSKRPLGDPLRPPPMFMDTGLLGHWGLRLDAPDDRDLKRTKIGGFDVVTAAPGRLSGSCDVSRDGIVARCRIGNGRVTVIADADFLAIAGMGLPTEHDLDGLLGELARIGQG